MNAHPQHTPRPAPWRMAPALLALLLFGGAGCTKDAAKGAAKRQERRDAVAVTVHTVGTHTFQRRLELEGNLDPSERILVAPAIPGVIRSVTKRAGDRITKGELLVEVDPKEVYVGTIQLRVNLAAAQARVRAAGAVLARLDAPMQRLRRLFEAKAISRAELDKVEIPYVQAQAERDAGARIIKNVQGELGIAYSKLSDTKITAPFDGYVVRRLADPGETARPFPPTVVLVITKHDPLYVQAEVNEEDVARLQRRQPVEVRIDALPGRAPLPGVLEEIIPYVNPMTRTVTVRVRVANTDGTLMPGMSARLGLSLTPQALLALPQEALATEPLERRVSVFVVDGGGVARERKIRFGRSQDGWVTVEGGLKAGERVIRTGHDQLLDGTRVTVGSAPAPGPRVTAQRPERATP